MTARSSKVATLFLTTSVLIAAPLFSASQSQDKTAAQIEGLWRHRSVTPIVANPHASTCSDCQAPDRCLDSVTGSASASYSTAKNVWARVYNFGTSFPATHPSNAKSGSLAGSTFSVSHIPCASCGAGEDSEVVVWVEFEDGEGNLWEEWGSEIFAADCSDTLTEQELVTIFNNAQARANIVVDSPAPGKSVPVHQGGIRATGTVYPKGSGESRKEAIAIYAKVYSVAQIRPRVPRSPDGQNAKAAKLTLDNGTKAVAWGLSHKQLRGVEWYDPSLFGAGRRNVFVIWVKWRDDSDWTWRAYQFRGAAGPAD